MAVIKKNFADVPDKVKPVPAGEYLFLIEKADIEEIDKGKLAGKQALVVQLKIDDPESESNGRVVFDRMTIDTELGDVVMKQLQKAAGLVPGPDGLDTDDLVGKHVRGLVKNRTYKNDAGETVEAANVKQYLIN